MLDDFQEHAAFLVVVYCLMPSHGHLVLWPARDGELSESMQLVGVTHTQRFHAIHHTSGTGPVYQGRFKSFPFERDEHALTVCCHVERNALRARLCRRPENWPSGGAPPAQVRRAAAAGVAARPVEVNDRRKVTVSSQMPGRVLSGA